MKYYSSDLEKVIPLIYNSSVKALLLHGENIGYFYRIINLILKKSNMILKKISYDLSLSEFLVLVKNRNFFDRRFCIVIDHMEFLKKDNLQDFFSKISFGDNFLCFIKKNKSISSKNIEFFIKSEDLVSIYCPFYPGFKVKEYILGILKKIDKTINYDALQSLISFFIGKDFEYINNELKKLILSVHNVDNITKKDIDNISLTPSIENLDSIFFSMRQDNLKLLELISSLEQDLNFNEILVIRNLLKHYMNLYCILYYIQEKKIFRPQERIEFIVQELQLFIYYKHIDFFKREIKFYTLTNVLVILKLLQTAEIKVKQNKSKFNLFLEVFIPIKNTLKVNNL